MNKNPIPLTEAQVLYYDDLARLRGKRGDLLELLFDGLWHPNYDCAKVGGLSFNCSIAALRREGWLIESRPKGHGVWEYRLTGKGDPPSPKMSRPQAVISDHYASAIHRTLGGEALSVWREHYLSGYELCRRPGFTERPCDEGLAGRQ